LASCALTLLAFKEHLHFLGGVPHILRADDVVPKVD
jgi:hypothetical protein